MNREQVAETMTTIMQRGITIKGVAEAAGVQESLVRQVMQGKIRPSFEIRLALAEAFGIDVNHIH